MLAFWAPPGLGLCTYCFLRCGEDGVPPHIVFLGPDVIAICMPQSIARSMQPPLCPGHREPSVIRTVKKGGENQGTPFHLCRVNLPSESRQHAVLNPFNASWLQLIRADTQQQHGTPSFDSHPGRRRAAIFRVQPGRRPAATRKLRLLPMGGSADSARERRRKRQQKVTQHK